MDNWQRIGWSLLSVWLVTSPFPLAVTAQECPPTGDVNQDRRLTPADALLTLRHALGLIALDTCAQGQANVHEPADPAITAADAACVLQRFLGLPSCLANVAPLVVDDVAFVLENVTGTIPVLTNDADFEGILAPASVMVIAGPSNGAAIVQADGSVRYTPQLNFAGPDSFLYTVADTEGASSTAATVTIHVSPETTFRSGPCNCLGAEPQIVMLGGNFQSLQAGEGAASPLVVQVQDADGTPLPGVELTATVTSGQGDIQPVVLASLLSGGSVALAAALNTLSTVTVRTDTQGQASFFLQADAGSNEDIIIEMMTPEFPAVAPVQFLAIIGTVDTPDIPLDLAVATPFVYIADRFSGIQVIDVSDPLVPVRLHQESPVNLEGTEVRLALAAAASLAYVVTISPHRLYIVDITDPQAPSFPADVDNDGVPDIVRGQVALPMALQFHNVTGIAVQAGFAYVVTADRMAVAGSLQIIDIQDPNQPVLVGSASLASRPEDIAVAGDVAYVPAGEGGIVLFDISDPTTPVPPPAPLPAALPGIFRSGIALEAEVAYVVESIAATDHFTVLDLSNPLAPLRRQSVPTGAVSRANAASAIAARAPFAYLVQGAFGLQTLDVQDPDAPRLLSRLRTTSVTVNVAATDDVVYLTDQIDGTGRLRVLQIRQDDADIDGVIDALDVFPDDRTERQDTDGDGLGDNRDLDDDNDGFTDAEETLAEPPTDPLDPTRFPVTPPPTQGTTVVVDAASPFPPRLRNGTDATPYRSLTEGLQGLQALRQGAAQPDVALTLLVRAGTYSPLTTQERFPLDLSDLPNLTIQSADGPDVTVLDAGFTDDVFVVQSSTQITLEGLTLLHGASGFIAADTTAITLRQNTIAEHIFDGVAFLANAAGMISDNVIRTQGSNGIFLLDASAVITGNTIRDNSAEGIFAERGAAVEITGNTIMENGASGIVCEDTAPVTIASNTIHRNGGAAGDGIELLAGAQGTIRDNTVSAHGSTGIFLENATATITGNTVQGNGREGIFVEGGISVEITGNNRIMDNDDSGIVIEDTTTATVAGNDIRNNGRVAGDGMALLRTATGIIRDNIVMGHSGNGIFLEASNATLMGNTIQGNNAEGIFAAGGATIAITSNNLIADNGSSGIVLDAVTLATVTANDIRNNGGLEGDGLVLRAGTTGTVSDNTISAHGSAGVFLSAATATFTGNIIRQNGAGMVLEGAMVTMPSGTITENNGDGVLLTQAASADIGLDSGVVTLAQNTGVGLFVAHDDGSVARINRAQIIFTPANGEGDFVGNVVDVAASK